MTVSFAIVNWNGGDALEQCLGSIEAQMSGHPEYPYEIVVVDNASADLDRRQVGRHPHTKLCVNPRNRYFAKATNQSVDLSVGDLLFVVNNDVAFTDALPGLIRRVVCDPTMVYAPALAYPDGRFQPSVRRLPRLRDVVLASLLLNRLSPRLDRWLCPDFDASRDQDVEQPMFSAVIVPRAIWEEIGGLDESLPLFFNDVDWFHRLRASGRRCRYLSGYTVLHRHGHSVNRRPFRKVVVSSVGMMRYFFKTGPRSVCRALATVLVVSLSAGVRLANELLRYMSRP